VIVITSAPTVVALLQFTRLSNQASDCQAPRTHGASFFPV
jgi:hypothetical protein